MSDVQAFAKIALFCDKYRENSKNPESGIDLRLVLKHFFIPVVKMFSGHGSKYLTLLVTIWLTKY